MNRQQDWLWISNIVGIGRKSIKKLIDCFETPQGVYKASEMELKNALNNRMQQIDALLEGIRNKDKIIQNTEKLLKRKQIEYATIDDNSFIRELHIYEDMPYLLYYKGKLIETKKTCGVIGTRLNSEYGKKATQLIVSRLVKHKLSIISGMAKGIDAIAHKCAIDNGGLTYGIMACGLDICYPAQNIELFNQIIENGALISEYPPKTIPTAGLFPERNRIISAMSDKLLVIEAKTKSGTMITVEHALNQGKDIYAVPGRITDLQSAGCNSLIKAGATITLTGDEILEDMGIKTESIDEVTAYNIAKNNNILEKDLKVLYSVIDFTPKDIDTIIEETELDLQATMFGLLQLQLMNMIYETSKNHYIRI